MIQEPLDNIKEKECILLWSTQSGRSKACARRCARMIRLVSGFHHLHQIGAKHLYKVSIVGKQDINYRQGFHRDNEQKTRMKDGKKIMNKNIGVKNELACSLMSSGSSFDDFGADNFMSLEKLSLSNPSKKYVLLLFVSTTGDAEHCDTIQECWKALLQRSLPSNFFSSIEFCVFALGDRAYGPTAFCAAGRKLATRLVQLGAKPFCPIGYGDDGTPNGGVFADLDVWIYDFMLPKLFDMTKKDIEIGIQSLEMQNNGSEKRRDEHDAVLDRSLMIRNEDAPYCVDVSQFEDINGKIQTDDIKNGELSSFNIYESHFFQTLAPRNAYKYDTNTGMRILEKDSLPANKNHSLTIKCNSFLPIRGKVLSNERITATDWSQDVRHITIEVDSNTNKNNVTLQQQDTEMSTKPIHSSEIKTNQLPYDAGDVAVILPQNSPQSVKQFLDVLPVSIRKIADVPLHIQPRNANNKHLLTPWPSSDINNGTMLDRRHEFTNKNTNSNLNRITLRTILTCCAAINSLPEREDLRVLSYFCNSSHPSGSIQASKLREMSEPSSDLYVDYILREKRTFGDLLHDFDSIGSGSSSSTSKEEDGDISSLLTIEYLLAILPPLVPRAFSIASSPSELQYKANKSTNHNNIDIQSKSLQQNKISQTFNIELCVAIVKGKTSLGRQYEGVCSNYLASLTNESSDIRLWIRPGSFTNLPLDIQCPDTKASIDSLHPSFAKPVLCIGAGTGVAPLRSILREREIHRRRHFVGNNMQIQNKFSRNEIKHVSLLITDNVLFFGCRKASKDFHYASEWEQFQSLNKNPNIRIITAFSQDQRFKRYVQSEIRKAEETEALISKHLLFDEGAIYIAGGAKMARAVKDEIIEVLGKKLSGGEKDAKVLLKRLGRKGLFSVEAWS